MFKISKSNKNSSKKIKVENGRGEYGYLNRGKISSLNHKNNQNSVNNVSL